MKYENIENEFLKYFEAYSIFKVVALQKLTSSINS